MLEKLYNNIYYLGLKSGYMLRDFFRWFGKKIRVPLKAVGTVLFAALLMVGRTLSKTFGYIFKEIRDLANDVRRVFGRLVSLFKTDRQHAPAILKAYIAKAFRLHGVVFRFAVNTALPIAAFIVLCVTIHHYSSQTFALEITYNDAVIGCVTSESVFHDAQEQAAERLSAATRANSSDNLSDVSATYTIKPVKLTEITDASRLCSEILEHSDKKITNACGIYINGEFLCAVKNETDATTVFDSILKNYETGNANEVVGFVEDISYVQGLYPDSTDTIWDAQQLADKLNSKKSAAQYYTVEDGDTVSGIAQKFGLSTSTLFSQNPGMTETIHIGQQVLISREVNYIQVQITRTETHTVSVPYETEKVETSSLYSGTKRVKTKGVNGEQVVTELVTYVDGVRTSAKEVSRVTTKQPVTEVIQVGTKKAYSSGYSGSYSTTSYGGRFIWPAVGAYSISSGYGGSRHHGGVDIVKPGGHSTGALVVAAGSGTVTTAGYHSSYGYYVIINHGGGVSTLYAHMLKGSLKVSAGQRVSAGQAIGNVGSTGNVTGPHLHFEVRINGNRTNPLPYLGR